jgi:5-methylthioribose kinase
VTDYALLTSRDDVVDYLAETGLLARIAASADEAEVREVTAGNMNRVFIAGGPLGSLAVKQAPPFVQVAGPSWPMDPDRIGAEARAYELLETLVPDAVPHVFLSDLDRYVLVMEDLSELRVLRDELVDQVAAVVSSGASSTIIDFENLGRVVGRFVGELSLATSEQMLGAEAHAELIAASASPELCALTVDVVLDEPYREHEHNHWHPALEASVRALYSDQAVQDAVTGIRATFVDSAQALLHGDLHSGSIMVGSFGGGDGQKVVVFDPEFSFVGPIGLDLGLFWANLVIAAVAADAVGNPGLASERSLAVDASWTAFVEAWGDRADAAWLESVRRDAWRFAGVEAMRRVAGYSHAADLETLPADVAGPAQQTVFDLARHWIVTATPKESA